ncbi:peptidoglycan-binding protein [Candidatus Parcubacteria bacterium]|nr:peptidoglycan-binding protein [Candidatus Parcubacteria bacterium]
MKVKSRIARFGGLAVGLSMAFGFAGNVGAVTIAELQAQIALLMQQLQSLQGGSAASAAITSDLTVGSSGSQVVALQNVLISGGYLQMPAGVAQGYFGSLTKAAVQRWQAAVGLPATGFVGPLSRAKLAGSVVGGGTTTGGTVGSGAGVTGSITTPGAEGTLTVTSAPSANSTVYEGESSREVLAFKAKASGSDLAIQRVKVDLGTNSNVYRDAFDRISLVDDGGRTLASADLNSSTVVKSASDRYEITLTGFSSVVAKDATRTYSIKVDARDVVDTLTSYTISLSANGVRAIDGAGIDLYSPTLVSDVSKSVTIAASLIDSASLTVSTNASTPLSQEIVASSGSGENEADKVVLLSFDIRAEKDAIEITDLKNFRVLVTSSTGVSPATASTTYLFTGVGTGGQLLGTATAGTGDANGSDVDFNDISYTIPAGTTRTFTLAADIRSANATQATVSASFTGNATNVVGENSADDVVTSVSGSATSNSILVRNIGPVFSLVGTPTIARTTAAISTNSTSTATASFNLKIKAVGADVIFGTLASGTPMVSNVTLAGNKSFQIYQNGVAFNTAVYASSTDYAVPSSGVVLTGSNSFTLQENNEITIPVTYSFQGKLFSTGADVTAASYAVALERINWVSTNGLSASTFMAGKTEWRTPSVTLP